MRGESVAMDADCVRLLTRQPHPFANFVLLSDASNLSAAISAIAPLCTCDQPAAVILTNSVSSSVHQHLEASGFHVHDPMPAMAVMIDQLPTCPLPTGFEFMRIDHRADGMEWGQAFAEGYELPAAVGEAFAPHATITTMAVDAPLQYFAIRAGGRMVATTMLYLADGLAGIYAVATVPSQRRLGLAAYLTVEALRAARRVGYQVGVLQASPAGYPVYRRLGFSDFGAVPLYVRMPE